MVQRTRRKLFAIYWSTSALLFTALLAISVFMNYKKAKESEYYFFDNKVNVISQQIAFTHDLPKDFFQYMSADYQIYVYSETDNIWYSTPTSKKRKEELKETAKSFEEQLQKQTTTFTGSLPFRLQYTSTDTLLYHSYYGKKLEIETIAHETNTVLVLYDVAGKFLSAAEIFIYAALEVGGLLFLFILCNFFILIATKPIASSIQKQIEFVASASHELKSPVAVIQLNAETIPTVDSETGSHLLKIIIDECRHLTSMIQNLLLLASSDSQRLTVKRETLEIDHFFIEIYEHYYSYCKQNGHILSLTMDDRLPPTIQADKALLTQVMGILIDNAVSYSLPDTPFHLAAEPDHGFLKVSFKNIAPSIPKEQQEKLFDRFYQADSSQSAPNHSGLGLSIAKEILESHGGKIYLETCKNNQFIFSFQIPF